ncbi:MAG: DSD1 family PLP-dependent enzyme [Hyphomicrobiaceae bacterium]|nr:MAG: DSD1 family PLP-dependent enzyme [Hyphomicrobiaceae bacterium]
MPMRPPAAIGMPFAEVDTPALVIDLDAFERNLERMADFAARTGIRVRPHAKTHKSPEIAKRQIALGAVGVCCQKVAEAEVLVAGGVGDVLISNEVAGAAKLDRLAALARQARIGVCADDIDNVAEIEAAAAKAGASVDVLVEIDVGGRRCGTAPGAPAARIAKRIAAAPNLNFAGLQAYHGSAQHVRDPAERKAQIAQAARYAGETLRALEAVGLEARIIAGGGTGTYENETASGVYNELQPGSYVFMDADYARNTGTDGGPFRTYEHALFVLATVMSTPVPERCILDAGLKAFAVDSGMPTPWKLPGAVYQRPSDEHGVLDVSACTEPPRRGAKVLLVPGHCDPTVNLHDWYAGVRGLGTAKAQVECLWPVAARGALF